jgi:hypothetical protein
MRSLRTYATLTAAAPSFRRGSCGGMCASVAGVDKPEQGLDLFR